MGDGADVGVLGNVQVRTVPRIRQGGSGLGTSNPKQEKEREMLIYLGKHGRLRQRGTIDLLPTSRLWEIGDIVDVLDAWEPA